MPVVNKKRGDTVTIRVTVRNTGNVAHDFPVGASIQAPNGFITDLPFTRTGMLQQGESRTVTFTEVLGSATGEGRHRIIVAIWTDVSGSTLTGFRIFL